MSKFLDYKLTALKPYTPGEQPKEMQRLIKLNTNENPFPPSPKVIEAVSQAIENLNLYSDPNCTKAVSAVAEFYNIKNSNVFLSNGSDEVLAFVFHGLCPNGAAFADITYGFYKVFAAMFGVQKSIVPLDNEYKINIVDYKDLQETIFIANPNAPTAIVLTLSEIETLLRQNYNRLVVVDEAYIDFGGESAVKLIEKYPNLLVIQTFSKSRSLAGGRLGIAFAQDELIADLNKMKFSFNPYNVNSLSLIAAEEAMKDKAYFESCREIILKNRSYLIENLRLLGFRVLDSAANFVFVGQNEKITAEEYYKALRENNILVRYFPDERISDFVRISIGTAAQMQCLIQVTKNILEGINP